MASNDPDFVSNAADIIGPNLNPTAALGHMLAWGKKDGRQAPRQRI